MNHLSNRTTRRRAIGAGAGLLLLLTACSQRAANAAPVAHPTSHPTEAPTTVHATPVATTSVRIQNFAFNPPAIAVPVGSKVTWTNQDIEQHTVTARDKSFDSDALNGGKEFSVTFSKAGTFDYFCAIHPNMVGRVVVTAN